MIGYFVRHPHAASLLTVALLVLGAVAILGIDRETLPASPRETVLAAIDHPGAHASEIDAKICQRLRTALTGVSAPAELNCVSIDGQAMISARLVKREDGSESADNLSDALARVDDLPAGARIRVGAPGAGGDTLALLAVTGVPTNNGLLDYVTTLASRLEAISGVGAAKVEGLTQSELRVDMRPDDLRRLGLSAAEVVDTVDTLRPLPRTSSGDIARFAYASGEAGELEELVIRRAQSGGIVHLGDVADIAWAPSDPHLVTTIDGAPAAVIRLAKTRKGDAVRTLAAVDAVLEGERVKYDEPFAIAVLGGEADTIRAFVAQTVRNTAVGLALALAVLWLFFRADDAFRIALTFPTVFFAGVLAMYATGIPFNPVALLALLAAAVAIIDGNVAVADSIAVWRNKAAPAAAALNGARSALPGLGGAFAVGLCLLTPVVFSDGAFSAMLGSLAIILFGLLAINLAVAGLILPNHLFHPQETYDPDRRLSVRAVAAIGGGTLMPLVSLSVGWRYLAVGTSAAITIACAGMVTAGVARFETFPPPQGDTLEARLALTASSSQEQAEAAVDQLLTALDKVDSRYTLRTEDRQPLVEHVLVRYAVNEDFHAGGAHVATITVELLEEAARNASSGELIAAWRQAAGPLPDTRSLTISTIDGLAGMNSLRIMLSGDDPEQIDRANAELLHAVAALGGIRQARTDFPGPRPEVELRPNDYARTLGLAPGEIAKQLRAGLADPGAASLRPSGSAIALPAGTGFALDDLDAFPVETSAGTRALADLVTMQTVDGYPQLVRRGQGFVSHIVVEVDRKQTNPAKLAALIRGGIADDMESRNPGLRIAVDDTSGTPAETPLLFAAMPLAGLVAVFFVFAVLFRSLFLAAAVTLAVPFAMLGGLVGHIIFGMSLSIPALAGLAALAILTTGNSAQMIASFRGHLEFGNPATAAIAAARDRLRPLTATTLAVVLGLMPFYLSPGPQAEAVAPFVATVLMGLVTAAWMVLFILPAILAIVFDMLRVERWQARFDATPDRMLPWRGR
ncbi:efflux RND transporter permease subunit [Oricola sp.]|uniref:efflux RND transporter permease subunit n=1 Tax=Oricola sp. TaxID=1979950 RepID=UPI003BAC6B4D